MRFILPGDVKSPQTSPAGATYVIDLRLKIHLSARRARLPLILPQGVPPCSWASTIKLLFEERVALLFSTIKRHEAVSVPARKADAAVCLFQSTKPLSVCAARAGGHCRLSQLRLALIFMPEVRCVPESRARHASVGRRESARTSHWPEAVQSAVQPGGSRRGGTLLLEAACRERGLHPATFQPRNVAKRHAVKSTVPQPSFERAEPSIRWRLLSQKAGLLLNFRSRANFDPCAQEWRGRLAES